MTKVSIAILTYNRSSLLIKLIRELLSLTYRPLEIIVVDNHSADGTEKLMKTAFSDVIYIRTDTNLGATARNIGMQRASGEIIITLDDDLRGLTDGDIIKIVKIFKSRRRLGALNFKVLDHKTHQICNWVHHLLPGKYGNQEFITYEITEGAVAFRKSALERTGYYPENFFLSHEGPDLAMRLLDNGFEVIYSPNIEVIHCHSQLGRKSWTNYYYDNRNMLWLAARNLPVSYTIIYLSRGLVSMLVYSLRDGFFYFWIKGLVDGMKGMNEALAQRKVIKKSTLRLIRSIDKKRPNLIYLIKVRFGKKGIRL